MLAYTSELDYEQALRATDKSRGMYIDDKAHINLGNVYRIQAEVNQQPELYLKATQHFFKVIDGYNVASAEFQSDARRKDLVGNAYCGLGDLYFSQEKTEQAIESYEECLNLSIISSRKNFARERLETFYKRAVNLYKTAARIQVSEQGKTSAATAYCSLGDLYFSQEKAAQAVESYEECLNLSANPDQKQHAEVQINVLTN